MLARTLAYLPRGNTLDAESFHKRHLLLCWILGLHVPALFVFGVVQGFGAGHSALEVALPAACVVFARLARNRRVAGFFVSAGLVYCSSALVHLSEGTIEAHFHFFILVGLIGLYQDWVPFLLNVGFTVLSHGLGSSIASDLMFNHDAAQNRPWTWAVIHGVAVLAACLAVVVLWKNTEMEQQRNTALVADLAEAELGSARAEAARRQAVSELFVNLARRNQSLLDRQLNLIAELETRERDADELGDLFQLDHLATRIRRNAESLLVLSGEEAPRRWGRPVALGEVVRAAAAEVEDFDRVEVLVSEHLEVTGRAVADLAHLLAELIENATTFSPPVAEVRVRSHLSPSDASTYVVSVEDTGIGMSAADLASANELLAHPPDVDLARSTLGFHVVGRLARRYNLRVRLANTPGGGVTALVSLPDDLVGERSDPAPAPAAAPMAAGLGRSRAMAGAAVGTAGRAPAALDAPMAPMAPPVAAPPVSAAPVLGGPPPEAPSLGGPSLGGPVRIPGASLAAAGGSPGGPEAHPFADLRMDGLRADPPAAPTVARPGVAPVPPAVPAAEVPAAHHAPEAPIPAAPPRTPDGLVRRVPGAGLASLRRSGAGLGAIPPAGPGAAPASGAGAAATPPADGLRPPPAQASEADRERMRSMLSRFQSSQQAGRSAAPHAPDPTQEGQ